MAMFDSIAARLLDHLLKAAASGRHPDLSALLHKLLAGSPENFQKSLKSLVAKHGWQDSKPLLRVLRQTRLREWIPVEFLPTFVFIDLERDPITAQIREFAMATSDPFTESPEVDALVASRNSGVKPDDIRGLLSRHAAGNWMVGHNIRAFDAVVLREAGVDVPEEQLLDTLELSLVLDPLRSRHALDGDHSAREDVIANIQLFWSLDRHFLERPHREIDDHRSWTDPSSGFGRYRDLVAFRKRSCAPGS